MFCEIVLFLRVATLILMGSLVTVLNFRQRNIFFKFFLNSFMRNKYTKGLINEFSKENNTHMALCVRLFSPRYS